MQHGQKPTWQKTERSTATNALHALHLLTSSHSIHLLAFCILIQPPATGPLHKPFPLPRTPSLYLIDCKLPCRSWLNCHFITKAFLGLQSLLANELWARIPGSECLGLNSSSRHIVYMTFLCLCFLIFNIGKIMKRLSNSKSVST